MDRHRLLADLNLSPEEIARLRAIWEEGHPHDRAQLIGSREWVEQERERERRSRRVFMPVRSLKDAYHTLESRAVKINAKETTALGMALDASLINRIELTQAVLALTEMERDCWLLSALDRMSYDEIATFLDTTRESVETSLSTAGRKLVARIFEPLIVRMHL